MSKPRKSRQYNPKVLGEQQADGAKATEVEPETFENLEAPAKAIHVDPEAPNRIPVDIVPDILQSEGKSPEISPPNQPITSEPTPENGSVENQAPQENPAKSEAEEQEAEARRRFAEAEAKAAQLAAEEAALREAEQQRQVEARLIEEGAKRAAEEQEKRRLAEEEAAARRAAEKKRRQEEEKQRKAAAAAAKQQQEAAAQQRKQEEAARKQAAAKAAKEAKEAKKSKAAKAAAEKAQKAAEAQQKAAEEQIRAAAEAKEAENALKEAANEAAAVAEGVAAVAAAVGRVAEAEVHEHKGTSDDLADAEVDIPAPEAGYADIRSGRVEDVQEVSISGEGPLKTQVTFDETVDNFNQLVGNSIHTFFLGHPTIFFLIGALLLVRLAMGFFSWVIALFDDPITSDRVKRFLGRLADELKQAKKDISERESAVRKVVGAAAPEDSETHSGGEQYTIDLKNLQKGLLSLVDLVKVSADTAKRNLQNNN